MFNEKFFLFNLLYVCSFWINIEVWKYLDRLCKAEVFEEWVGNVFG